MLVPPASQPRGHDGSLVLAGDVLTTSFFWLSFDGDDFDDVEEDEGLDDLENAEEVSSHPQLPTPQPGC